MGKAWSAGGSCVRGWDPLQSEDMHRCLRRKEDRHRRGGLMRALLLQQSNNAQVSVYERDQSHSMRVQGSAVGSARRLRTGRAGRLPV